MLVYILFAVPAGMIRGPGLVTRAPVLFWPCAAGRPHGAQAGAQWARVQPYCIIAIKTMPADTVCACSAVSRCGVCSRTNCF